MRTRTLAAALLSLILALPVLGASHEPPSVGSFAEVPAGTASARIVDREHTGRRPIEDRIEVPAVPTRPRVVQPKPRVVVVTVGGGVEPSSHRASGVASWYCGHGSSCTRGYPGGLYAAAGPALRVGQWRGRRVHVEYAGRSLVVVLIDWCACPGGRVLDLYRDAFSRLADPSRGILGVQVTW